MEDIKLYSEIEHLIITWNIDGTKTAGYLTREIMGLINQRKLYKELGDIYVLTNKDIKGFSSSVSRIGKHMGVSVVFHSYL